MTKLGQRCSLDSHAISKSVNSKFSYSRIIASTGKLWLVLTDYGWTLAKRKDTGAFVGNASLITESIPNINAYLGASVWWITEPDFIKYARFNSK